MQGYLTMKYDKYDKYRNPSNWIRITIVSIVFALYGCLAGTIVSVFLGYIWLCATVGALLAAAFGAKLESNYCFFETGESKQDNANESRPPKS